MKDRQGKPPGRDDFFLVMSPMVDDENRWTGDFHINIITQHDNQLDREDFLAIMDYVRYTAASLSLMDTNPRYKEMLEEQADMYLPRDEIKKSLKDVKTDGNVIRVDFTNKE